jgi:hypothetical protein
MMISYKVVGRDSAINPQLERFIAEAPLTTWCDHHTLKPGSVPLKSFRGTG